MDKKLTAICIMTLTAVALMIANFLSPPPAHAEAQAMNRDYQAITAMIPSGGEGLYIVDNRTGLMAIFTYDPNSRTVVPRAARPVTDAFK